MDPDIHWSAMAGHASALVINGGKYDKIITIENFKEGMKDVLKNVEVKHDVDIDNMPHFNESEGHGPKRLHPVEDYFDDLSMHMVYKIYKRDFNLFKYDSTVPSRKEALGEPDMKEIYAKLGDNKRQLNCENHPKSRAY